MKTECPECGAIFNLDSSLEKQARALADKRFQEANKKANQEFENQKKLLQQNFDKAQKQREEELLKSVEKNFQSKIESYQKILEEKEKGLAESEQTQLKLRQKMLEVERKEKSLELEVLKQVEEKSNLYKKQLLEQEKERHDLELKQKDRVIIEMQKQTELLQQKIKQGSQQAQGEVVEEHFEELLKNKYLQDEWRPVPKGVQGADLIQTVYDKNSQKCGVILWEFKNTKNFSQGWIDKLKQDQRTIGAEAAVLVTKTLPKEQEELTYFDGIYVVSYKFALFVTEVLRQQLLLLNRSQLAHTNKDQKMELMYNYFTGQRFIQKFKGILSAYQNQKEELEKEKRAMNRIWAKREAQLTQVIDSATSMFGEIEAILGPEVPVIDELQLDHHSDLS